MEYLHEFGVHGFPNPAVYHGGGIEKTQRHGKIGDIPERGFFHLSILSGVVRLLLRPDKRPGEVLKAGDEILYFQDTEHIIIQNVICVQAGVRGHKSWIAFVLVLIVDIVRLTERTSAGNESIR